MMNRIILIGNGFDLAHGLRTSYMDFIEDYWENWVKSLGKSNKNSITDGLATLTIQDKRYCWNNVIWRIISNRTATETLKFIRENKAAYEIKYTPFFKMINKAIEAKGWVDIENEFYLWLKMIFKKEDFRYRTPDPLNEELESIKKKLAEYLKFIEDDQIKPELVKDCIRSAIYEPFAAKDISNESTTIFIEFLIERLKLLATHSQEEINAFLNKYNCSYSDIDVYNDSVTQHRELLKIEDRLSYSQHIANVYKGRESVPDVYLLPDQILFLNFNYTSTADLYIPKGSEFKVNHIHGELGNDNNPIIFGYGDELDDDYKEMSKLNDNDYLKNIKSILYMETDNYRKLLSFIDSAPFQIYIMGHSCGNSDRTLLNTLFEHKNCVSIKPFYYEKSDGSDNYIEIIQNISRNFNDMRLMRDRVVNKTYCRPLVPQGK